MNRATRVAAFLIVTSSALTAHANMGNRTNYYGNRGPQAKAAKRSTPTSRATTPEPTLAKVRDVAKAEPAAKPAKPLNLAKVQRTWEKAFLKDADDDQIEIVFPEALVVSRKTLPAGSVAAADVERMRKKFDKDLITVFREPKRGTFAIQEASDGESDFRLRVYDATGAEVARISIADDGSSNGWTTPPPPPTSFAAPTSTVARPAPVRSNEPFRDINRRSGGNI